ALVIHRVDAVSLWFSTMPIRLGILRIWRNRDLEFCGTCLRCAGVLGSPTRWNVKLDSFYRGSSSGRNRCGDSESLAGHCHEGVVLIGGDGNVGRDFQLNS